MQLPSKISPVQREESVCCLRRLAKIEALDDAVTAHLAHQKRVFGQLSALAE
jgi:hypothetical protein